MVKLYTLPTCPRCSVVKKKLDEAHIDYEICEDEKEMEEKGIDLLPAMEAGQDEEIMDFAAILAFIKAHNEEGGNR